MKKILFTAIATITAITGLASLASAAETPPAPAEPSPSLHYATYIEKVGDVTVVVGSRIASFHPDEDFVPLVVAVRVRREGEPLTVGEESFTLLDSEGNSYQAVELAELRKGYQRLNWDWNRLARQPLVTGTTFNLDRRTASRFYPGPRQGVRLSPVRLRGGTYLSDLVYFPRPAGGLGGILTLRVSGGGIPSPIDVRFEVPSASSRPAS